MCIFGPHLLASHAPHHTWTTEPTPPSPCDDHAVARVQLSRQTQQPEGTSLLRSRCEIREEEEEEKKKKKKRGRGENGRGVFFSFSMAEIWGGARMSEYKPPLEFPSSPASHSQPNIDLFIVSSSKRDATSLQAQSMRTHHQQLKIRGKQSHGLSARAQVISSACSLACAWMYPRPLTGI